MKNNIADDAAFRALFEAISQLASPQECQRFLEDLCTPAELKAFADRWQAACLIAKGLPYREISQQTGTSTATITRVARSLSYGDGGYRLMLERLDPLFSSPHHPPSSN